MSDIATLRRRIGDRPKAQRDIATGNGADRSFHLQFENVYSVIVTINDVEKAINIHYALDGPAGRIIFIDAPIADARVQIDYNYAAYTDQEITELVTETGSVDGATVAMLEELTADSARFYDFTQGETTNKKSQVFDHLVKLLERYQTAIANGGTGLTKRRSGIRFGKRSSGREYPALPEQPNFGGTQDLTRYP